MLYARGTRTLSLCDRCGLTYEYLQIRNERGTTYRVCKWCDDGKWNLMTHPQNGPFPFGDEGILLRYPRADVAFVTVGTSVSVWLSLTPYGSWEG